MLPATREVPLPRFQGVCMPLVLYICAAFMWYILLHPYPVTVFMAACLSCALFPLHQRIQRRIPGWRGLAAYVAVLCTMISVPISVLVLLVVPQAAAGLSMLQRLRENNFQMPPSWLESWEQLKVKLSVIPGFESMLHDLTQNLESGLSNTIGTLISGGVGLVGSTITAIWLVFLFMTLTVLCSVYAQRIFAMTVALTRMPADMVDRFVKAIRGALRGVLLGVVLVALAQGLLCGVGFAVAGVKQPAFWGLLATLVAPIPVVGTALVWMPLCVMLWFSGATFAAVGLSLWGTLAVAGVDNILRPLFLKQGINAPLFVLVLAILCGMASFGPVGLIAGPVAVAFAIQAVQEADALHRLKANAHPRESD